MLGIFGTLITVTSDLALLVVMSIGLFYVDPFTAVSTFIFFLLVALALYKQLNVKARLLGRLEYEYAVKTNEKISELMGAYRELTVRNRRSHYIDLLSNLRRKATSNTAEIAFLPNYSKYVMEAAVIVGFLLIAASQFLAADNSRAVPTVVIFLTAGSRIAPALLRLQQGAVSMRQAAGTASGAVSLIAFLEENSTRPEAKECEGSGSGSNSDFQPSVRINNLSYTFPGEDSALFSNLNLEIAVGQIVAIVGPSGAGKTTLVDLLLGVRRPESGEILISGKRPSLATAKWPGAVAYVPQDVSIFAGTLKENIGLGYSNDEIESDAVDSALDKSMLRETVNNLTEGIETLLGERGTRFSGGQRQRLGIARALFTKPKLIIFDEATSSLDGVTELNVTKQIYDLGRNATLILIAHRLSTVRDADLVIYLANGQIVASGSFEEVRSAVPDFATQAKLMGL
jgi:ABC-type multidrug transport system fused ATPase/permease subunit